MKNALASSSLLDNEDDPTFWTKTACLQLGYGLWVNLTVVGIGLAFGWPAVTIPQLVAEDSKMHVSLGEQAWIASVLTLFSPIGSLICGYLMDRYGRKCTLIFCELPICVGWIYTACASTPFNIIVGRVITGIGLGFAMGCPRAYITEMTLPNMRGVIGALPNIAVAIGITIQALLGSFIKWYILCVIGGIYAFILFVTYFFLPETPYYVLMKSDVENAKSILKKFRSESYNLEKELEELNDFKQTNDIRRLNCMEKIRELLKTSSCKPLGIGLAYIILMQASGVSVIMYWGVDLLERSNVSIDAHIGNLILAITRVISGIITSVLLYKVGRRVLALSSAIGVGLVSIGLAFYLYYYEKEAIYPLVLFIAYMIFATLGYYTLPFLILYELIPLQVRGILSGIVTAIFNLLMFGMTQCYPYMRNDLGLHMTMAIFGIVSLLGALLLYFILPETKGLTLQEIEEYFNSTRPSLVPSRQYIATQSVQSHLDLTKASSYERKKQRSMLSLQKLQDENKKQHDEVKEDGKLKTIYSDKKGDSIKPSSSKKHVALKDERDDEIRTVYDEKDKVKPILKDSKKEKGVVFKEDEESK